MEKVSESTLIIEREINASAKEIFEALTKESLLRQWFYPVDRGFSVAIDFEARVGGSYQINMIDPDGKVFDHSGEIKELIPNEKITFSWNSHAVEDTLVSIQLLELDNSTKLTLIHEFKSSDDIGGHEKGWKELLENLNNNVTNR